MKKYAYFMITLLCLIPTNSALASSPFYSVYRFWSNAYKGHFYTADADEASYVDVNYSDDIWKSEGEKFMVYHPEICDDLFFTFPELCKPVYRFWSSQYKHHFYTISESEKNYIVSSMPEWQFEKIEYAASTEYDMVQGPAGAPLYRFWSDTYRGHFYTMSESERDSVAQNMPEWRYEGVAYYVIDPTVFQGPN